MSVPYELTIFNEVFNTKRSEEKNVLQSMLLSSYHMMLISSSPSFFLQLLSSSLFSSAICMTAIENIDKQIAVENKEEERRRR